jgi:hypothetical protein
MFLTKSNGFKTSFVLNKNLYIKKRDLIAPLFYNVLPSNTVSIKLLKSIGQLIVGRNWFGDNEVFFTNSYTSVSV